MKYLYTGVANAILKHPRYVSLNEDELGFHSGILLRCFYQKRIQRLYHIHKNPVEQGFVQKAEEWLDSSCSAYFRVGKSKC